jgi:hypothetical protein
VETTGFGFTLGTSKTVHCSTLVHISNTVPPPDVPLWQIQFVVICFTFLGRSNAILKTT